MSSLQWEQVTANVRSRCANAGLDLAAPLQVAWYNQIVDHKYRLPDFGRERCLAILVGNTKALWLQFLESIRNQADLRNAAHPIDTYTQLRVEAALAPIPHRWLTRYGHKANHRVALQRLAHVAGLAYLSSSHLSVHPVYGPWIGLRAVCVIDIDGPPEPPAAIQQSCQCEANCAPAFRAAIAHTDEAKPTQGGIAKHWRSWLAVRDACPVGRIHRYCDAQIRYHYLHDPKLLPPRS